MTMNENYFEVNEFIGKLTSPTKFLDKKKTPVQKKKSHTKNLNFLSTKQVLYKKKNPTQKHSTQKKICVQ
jgi:hypothetical protein